MKPNTTIEYDGRCAFALSLGKTPPETSKKHLLTKDGRTYSFLNPIARFFFKLSSKSIEKADKNWNQIKE